MTDWSLYHICNSEKQKSLSFAEKKIILTVTGDNVMEGKVWWGEENYEKKTGLCYFFL